MYNEDSQVIYVGKAKALKKRLASYFRKDPGSTKTRALVKQITAIDVTVTHSEAEALLLENNYIKKYQPKYNILLRDDKSYPYILITQHRHPKIGAHRGSKRIKGEYFGPYTTVGAVWESLRLMQRLFPIRQCEDSYYRARSRPCLQYQLKRCSAPCVGKISDENYSEQVNLAKLFLRGKNSEVIASLVEKMELASQQLNFEQAATFRDQIATLRQVQHKQFVSGVAPEMDVLALFRLKTQVCVHKLLIRDSKILGSKSFFPTVPDDATDGDVMQAFISQYYLAGEKAANEIAREIVVAEPLPEQTLLAQLLTEQAGREVKISSRVKTERAKYLALAMTNAESALSIRNTKQESIQARLQAVNELFELDNPIKRMECFDISHTMGQQTIASCVVFDENGPFKNDYRRYNVVGITPGDDYAAMDFALKKRFSKVTSAEKIPDIVFIDGGKGQLGRAEDVIAQLNLVKTPLLVGIAKGESRKPGLETLILAGNHQKLNLPANSPALHLIQHIRDESHRFAIAGHRAKRAKVAKSSVLESIPGIGPKKRQALLKFMGGLQQLKRASIDELCQVPGINKELAAQIYTALHDK